MSISASIQKVWNFVSGVGGVFLMWLGFADIPDNLTTWAGWLGPYLNQETARWVFVIFGFALIASLFPWRALLKKRPAAQENKSDISDRQVLPESLTDFDVWIRQAVNYIITREWFDEEVPDFGGNPDGETIDNYLGSLHKSVKELLQAASEGKITIGGQISDHGIIAPIQKDYWHYYGLDIPSFLAPDAEDVQTELKVQGKGHQTYTNLMTNKAAVEALWPPRTENGKGAANKHDVPLLDAIHYFSSGKWGARHPSIDEVKKASQTLRQFACDGDLTMWGIRDPFGEIIYEKITDTSYWQNYWESESSLETNGEDKRYSLDETKDDAPLYYSLSTSKAEVERLWQQENT